MCLCLTKYSIYLLQPSNVGVFDSLKQNYKTWLALKIWFTTYNIEMADFIILVQKPEL